MYFPRREPSTGPTFAPPPPDAVDRRPIGNGGSLDAGPQRRARCRAPATPRPRARSAI